MIRAENITRFYGRFEAVSEFSFTAKSGEVVGLLGQNGAGKTTIMNVLAGCLSPSSGRVFINNKDLAAQPHEARRSLGYLPEVPPVYPEMTVQEYLIFSCRIKGVLKADEKDHIKEIMELTGLHEVKHQLIARLSKGFRQRAGLAQDLCGDPEVLLLDEPTAGFDPIQAIAFRKLIRRLVKNKAILFSSHLLSEVQEICDRVLIIHNGKMILDRRNDQEAQSTQYRLIVQGLPSRILSPIRQLASVKRARLTGEKQTDVARLLIETEPGSAFAGQLFTLLSGLNTPIMELTPLQDSLETLFLQVNELNGTDTK